MAEQLAREPGRRERKKAATRKAISNAATELFLERGFDHVSIREVAEKADVSPTTVFAHFPQKEALIFDEDDDQREQLVAAVRDRRAGIDIPTALRTYYQRQIDSPDEYDDESVRLFLGLIDSTPALTDYAQRMWLRHEDALAAAIATDLGLAAPSDEVRAFSRFVLQTQLLSLGSPDAAAMVDAAFALLEPGWAAYAARLGRG
ncbi:MAG: TetR/AcrR family transcriptional regulator [Microbacteriaceae bacterium]|nr:TetR/AcrR family transcriptional regulator [Microbacteriaceae bacterium]MCL2795622.1 TetR/AcrR family transcriptional regulator [Microbacteriaceae bacterium]